MPRRKEEPGVDVTLPITPMLDMSFQLLSFFVVTFRPPSQEGQLSVDLPKLDASSSPSDPITIDSVKDEYTITVNGDTDIRAISLKGPTVTEKPVADTGSLYAQLKQMSMDTGHIADDLLTQMYHNSKKAAGAPPSAGAGTPPPAPGQGGTATVPPR